MKKLPYFKPFLTFEEQARLLEERGLLIANDENRKLLVDFLRSDNTDNNESSRIRKSISFKTQGLNGR